jgi:membrane-associated protease RseP (regulator of RpoE activity)
MAGVIGVLVLVVGLLISIALHEVGHMVPAKKFGVRVSQYFVGFGPTLWSRQGKETEYGLKAIPLGGYVRLVGMVPPAERVKSLRVGGGFGRLITDAREVAMEEVHEGEDHRSFYQLAWWKKVIVMFGGPFVNLLLAVLMFTVVLSGIGLPTSTLTVERLVPCVPSVSGAECDPSDPASPAVEAGLEPGDVFVAVDGRELATWVDLTGYVSTRAGEQLTVSVDRDGERLDLTLTPAALQPAAMPGASAAADPNPEPVGFMGVYAQRELQGQSIGSGTALTVEYTGLMAQVVAKLPSHIYHVTRAALGLEERNPEGIIGLVGIGRVAAESAEGDTSTSDGLSMVVARMLLLLGSLNLALFVFNMIPLVPLDGGHIASAFWQAIKNGWARLRNKPAPNPVDVARMMPLAYGVFALLILMGIVLIVADIVAPVTLS